MKTSYIILSLLTVTLGAATALRAETIYVDQRFGPGGNGTANAPYNTIQAAINDSDSSEVIIYPGRYTENLRIQKSVTIRGYDGPLTTVIDGSAPISTEVDVITITRGFDVRIEGVTITSGVRHGVFQPTDGKLYLRNCVICGNGNHGVYVDRTEQPSPYVYAYNCVLAYNSGSGVYLNPFRSPGGYYHSPSLTMTSTILVGNVRYAIELSASTDYQYLTLDYNDAADNGLGNYYPPTKIVPGPGSITVSPEFVGGAAFVCNKDFRLLPSSPCRDTGHPGNGFLDPDGTRSDMGAYGGPGSQTFYTSPNDGPFVRSVTIDQSVVPRGERFTIRADGAVR